MSKQNSNSVPIGSIPGLPSRLNSNPNANVDETNFGEEEHLYSNFGDTVAVDCGRQRAMTESSKTRVGGKKPMPAPKPDFTKTDTPQKKLTETAGASRRKSNTDIVKTDRFVPADVPEESLYEEAIVVKRKLFEKNDAPEEPLYSEPLAVAGHLLPSDERRVREADLSPEPIYDEASAVCASRLPPIEKPKWPVGKSPEQPEENLYEDAATVSIKKLPSGEINGTVNNRFKVPVEPIYCEAEPVVSRKLPVEQKNFNGKPGSDEKNLYAEAAEVRKLDESSDEEEPKYFSLLLLQKSIANQTLLKSRLDPFQDKTRLDQNVRGYGAVKVLPTPPPKKFGQHLGLMRQESVNKQDSFSSSSKHNCLDGEWSDDLMGLQSCDEAEMNQMRKWILTNIIDSERSYCEMLALLLSYMNTLGVAAGSNKEIISAKDIDCIFFKIPELHRCHVDLVENLKPIVDKWSRDVQVGPIIKEMAFAEYAIANEYVRNHQEAISTVQRCWSESSKFAELTKTMKCGTVETSLEEMLRKPIERFQRNALVLHDLLKSTPTSHPDFLLLGKTLNIAKNFLEDCTGSGKASVEESRYLVKHGIVVEKPDKVRKLRQIFLFNDILVCCKQKISSRSHLIYEVKWFILLNDLILDDKFSVQEEKSAALLHQQEIDALKKELVRLQSELKGEMKKLKQVEGQVAMGHRQNRTIENIRKKLAEQEAELLVAMPHLQLKMSNKVNKKSYVLLVASDYERTNWKATISGLVGKAIQMPAKLSLTDVINLINSQRIPKLLGSALETNDISLQEERLNGNLNVTIHRLQGLKEEADTFCCIEVDSFGHFFMKAKTNRIKKTMEPNWNEDFDIDLEGAQSMHILCYKLGQQTDSLLGKCSLVLQKEWITEDFCEKAISLANELLLTVSLKYTSAEQLKRSSTSLKSGVFGVRFDRVAKKESKLVPIIVTSCVEEIERRGLKDVGIYRISGLSSEIQRLKKIFNRSSSQGASVVKEADTNVLTGLLKLFFRELPEALFTDSGYPEFVKGIGLSDPDAKQKFLVGQLQKLPQCNYSTVVYLLDHLLRVSQYEEDNKMSLENLAMVFGPTLLRPAEKEQKQTAVESLFFLGANEAAVQNAILLYFLKLKSNNYNFPTKVGK